MPLLPSPRNRSIVAAPGDLGRRWPLALAVLVVLVMMTPAVQGLITQPELTPTPAGTAAVPDPVTPERRLGPIVGWFNFAAILSAPIVLAGLWTANIIRPGSFGKRCAPAACTQPVSVMFVAAFLILLAQNTGGILVQQNVLPWPRVVSEATLEGRVAIAIGMAVFGCATALVLAAMATRGWRSLLSARDLGVGVLTLALAYPLVAAASGLGTLVVSLLQHKAPAPIAHETLNEIAANPTNPWVMTRMVQAAIAAPIIEEIMYRLFLQGALVKLFQGPWLGILVTSALFAASHLMGGTVPWHAMPPLFVLSVGLGIVHVRTGRIGPAIAAHAAFNVLNIVLTLAG